jgi:hypothetical protein
MAAALLLPLLLVATGVAHAQPGGAGVNGTTVGGSVAYASLWDDETHLGRGLAVAGELAVPAGAHVRLGAEAGWFRHDRDAGYLAADGTVLSVMARAALLLGPASWRAQPLVGAGIGVARSTGTLSLRSLGPGPGQPTAEDRSWTLNRLAWDVQLGIRVAAGSRLAVRPEVRAGVVGGAGDRGVLEPPLLRLQGGVALEWAVR